MKKLLITALCTVAVAGLIGASASTFAGYTTYSAGTDYNQPYGSYVPYYHGNTDSYTTYRPNRRYTAGSSNSWSYDSDYDYHYSDNDSYRYDYDLDYDYHYSDDDYYSDNDSWDYDIRYDNDSYYTDNTITHSDTYNIWAEDVDIDNNHYYANRGPYRRTSTYPIQQIFDQIPASEACQTRTYSARGDSYFEDLELRIPTQVSRIQKYRVRRSDGDRSRWYIPGDDDVEEGTDHRMWAHFGHYQHQITTCDHTVASRYERDNHYYYPMPSDGSYTHRSYENGYQQRYRDILDNADIERDGTITRRSYRGSTSPTGEYTIRRVHTTTPDTHTNGGNYTTYTP